MTAQAAPAAAARTPAPVPKCLAADLGVWMAVDQGDGAAGSIYYPLEFTNLSRHTCIMYGFPGISAIDRNARQLGLPARWDHSVKARTVVLHPGATAHTVLQYIDAAVFTPQCKPTPAYELRVYPPDQYVAAQTLWDLDACSLRNGSFMTVQVIQPGVGTRY
jgi:hypothetical protein